MFRIKSDLNSDNILKRISPLDIYHKYSRGFKQINKHFKSDFRDDPNPSAIVFRYNGTFLYKDFGESGGMNCFQFVMRMFDLSFVESLEKINLDFGLQLGNLSRSFENGHKYQPMSLNEEFKTIISVKRREFNERDLIWWGEQSWTREMLNLSKISPISHFRLTSERKNIDDKLFICDNYSYNIDYYWSKGIFRRKLYFPKKDKQFKWLSNTDKTVVQGWNVLQKTGDILFITSSLKDCGPMWRVYNKPCAIAPNAEGQFIPNKVFYKLKKRYDTIVLYFDNDETGIKNAKKFSQIYNIPYIYNPIGSPKDPSDFVKKEGLREFRNMLIRQLEDKNLNNYLWNY